MGVQVAEYKNQQTCFNVVTKTNNNHPDNKMIAKASIEMIATPQAEHADLTLPPKSPIPGRVMGKGRQRTFSTSATISTEREPIIRASRRTIYTAGRPPWYDSQGQQVEPFVIGVCGGSASGKTTVANKIISELGVPWVTLLSMDSFYKVLNEKQHEQAALNEYNFDHPDAFDFDLLLKTLKRLKEMKKVEVPIYNFVTHRRESKTVSMYGANVIIFEGILAFHMEEIRDILDMKIFVETDSDVRLARRLKRDISMRGRDIHGVRTNPPCSRILLHTNIRR